MNLFITTFESVAVLLGIGILGFWIISKRIVPGNVLSLLSPLALDVALPSLIFVNLILKFNPSKSPGWGLLPLWWIGFTVLAGILTIIGMSISKKNTRREFGISLFFQNAIFFPLVIITGVFGKESSYLVDLFLFTIFYPAFLFNTYYFFFGRRGKRLNWKRILHPVFVATLLAVIIRLGGMQDYIPGFVVSSLKLVGGMTIPLLMIIIGGNIYIDLQKKESIYLLEIMKFLLIKNILFPLVTLFLLCLLRPAYNIALIILLQSAVPPVTATPILTEREGGNRIMVNQIVIASFIFSLVSIPAMISLFGKYFTPI